ncbi:toll-like receptor Tollo [Centruroides sculpturatus]|uniref:toll-like receptor Tollo n=1 Tax=Centruroides sculpturatus TaxID=218467 RepID=UPI000C6E4052|nr:toll-like receptor Tollo [Centruroides sculpturatus]
MVVVIVSRLLLLWWCWWLRCTPCAGRPVQYVAPEDCSWETVGDSISDVALTCGLRTINGAFDSTNFSLIQPEHTVSLTVRCDDLLFASTLGNNSFHHLRELRSLSIVSCKLQEIPSAAFSGLGELRNLSVRTENSEWGEMSLRLHPDSLSILNKLERLDLSRNNMASLPTSFVCRLPHLDYFNLTHNDFTDVTSLGFTGQCRANLRQLDMSNGKLKLLTDGGFVIFTKLQILNLGRNRIARAEETSLTGLENLRYLDMSSNQLVALPPMFFRSTEQLTELYLQNNSISVLPPGLFSGLQQMVTLDISHNSITSQWLGPDIFADMIRLVVLDLSYNKLTTIGPSTFRSQYSLQILQLHHNHIENVADNAFASLYNLHTLVLSHNRMVHIDVLTFNGLYVVSTLTLDHNHIETIHADALRNSTNLQELNVASNRMKTVPQAIQSLQLLRSLDVGENLLANIHNATYQGLRHLYSLRLAGNRIGNLTKGIFRDLPSLRILSLARNRIQAIEQGTFDDVPDLHALRLDSNFIGDINGLFSNLHDLLMLNISANRISWFDYALIPIGLQWLDVHDNQIETLGNYFELESVLKLRTLDSSYNKIADIDASSLPNGIEIVFLNNNRIRNIQPFTFMGKANLTRVDLTNNNLETLEMNAFRLSEVATRRPLPEFSVAQNPYKCDCNMEWLQRIGTLDESRQYPRMVDVEDIICHMSFTRRRALVQLIKAQSSQFLCKYKSHCFALCHCCEFDACDCEMVCPENCTCYYDQSWNTNIVDCSSRSHQTVPKRIPMDVTELYLDGNELPSLSSHTFIGRKNMKILYLNNSNVQVIHNRTFNGLKALQVLNLEKNKITVLHGYEFERLTYLRELYLSHNLIATVTNITFVPLKSLEILYLDHNHLKEFQVWQLAVNPQLHDVTLSENPWTCECQFVQDFGDYIQDRGDNVRDLYDVTCSYNETTKFPLLEFNMTVCTNHTSTTYLQSFRVEDFMSLLIVCCSLFLAFLFLFILVYVYRRELSVWLYTRYKLRLCRQDIVQGDEDKLFDAFVSYSKKDEAFIAQILAPELECGNPPYRLCLHYRDLPVGGYLSDAIAEAMENSRRTILVLSENFLKSEWCRYEFKTAHHEVLSTRKHSLIVIVLGRIAYRDLEPDVKMWLKTSVFLRWGEKLFWEKLKYEMPEIRHRKTERNRNDVTVAVHI